MNTDLRKSGRNDFENCFLKLINNVNLILTSGLCDYCDVYILTKRTITVPETEATGVIIPIKKYDLTIVHPILIA